MACMENILSYCQVALWTGYIWRCISLHTVRHFKTSHSWGGDIVVANKLIRQKTLENLQALKTIFASSLTRNWGDQQQNYYREKLIFYRRLFSLVKSLTTLISFDQETVIVFLVQEFKSTKNTSLILLVDKNANCGLCWGKEGKIY